MSTGSTPPALGTLVDYRHFTNSPDILDRLTDVPPNAWDRLATGFGSSHRWLSFVDRDRAATGRYLVARDGDRLAGAVPVYRVHREDDPAYRPQRVLGGCGPGPYLLAGGRHGPGAGLLLAPDLPPSRRAAVAGQLLGAVDAEVARDDSAGACFLYLDTATAATVAGLPGSSTPQLLNADGWLPLPESTTRPRPVAGVSLEWACLGSCWDEAGSLLGEVRRDGRGPGYRTMLREHAEALDDLSVVIAARRRGRLVAFGLFYRWRDTLTRWLVGAAAGSEEYDLVAWHEPVRYAQTYGLRAVRLGRGAGCGRPRPLWGVLRADPTRLPADTDTRRWNALRRQGLADRLAPTRLTDPDWTRWQRRSDP